MILPVRYTSVKNLHKYLAYGFGVQKQQQSKIETRSFKKNVINDFSKIAYQPHQKLHFINNKCLIYKNNRTIFTSIMQSSLYWTPIIGISYLIYANPFADIFPAAIPLLCFVDLVLFKLWLNRFKWNENIVSQIYLFENGQATQIWFANQNKRKLFGEELKKIYYNSIFVNPDYEKQQVILVNKDNRMFPTSIRQAQKQQSGYAWVKHFSNGQNFLVIPKKGDLMNLKVLIQIFKGKVIKNKLSQ